MRSGETSFVHNPGADRGQVSLDQFIHVRRRFPVKGQPQDIEDFDCIAACWDHSPTASGNFLIIKETSTDPAWMSAQIKAASLYLGHHAEAGQLLVPHVLTQGDELLRQIDEIAAGWGLRHQRDLAGMLGQIGGVANTA